MVVALDRTDIGRRRRTVLRTRQPSQRPDNSSRYRDIHGPGRNGDRRRPHRAVGRSLRMRRAAGCDIPLRPRLHGRRHRTRPSRLPGVPRRRPMSPPYSPRNRCRHWARNPGRRFPLATAPRCECPADTQRFRGLARQTSPRRMCGVQLMPCENVRAAQPPPESMEVIRLTMFENRRKLNDWSRW